jgi:hypothetical protein
MSKRLKSFQKLGLVQTVHRDTVRAMALGEVQRPHSGSALVSQQGKESLHPVGWLGNSKWPLKVGCQETS